MNVVIVEDESHTAALLQEIIEQDADFIVIEKLESVADTVQYLNKYQKNTDLLFFDIQLADGLSFEIFKYMDIYTPVVFCTAYDDFAMQAIKNQGIEYILKPFKEEEIHRALQKYKNLKNTFQSKINVPIRFHSDAPVYQQSFLTEYRGKFIVKYIRDTALFCIHNEIVYLYNFKGEKFPLFKKMEYIESVCDMRQFFRINRQMLVNRSCILAIEPYFNRKVVLELQIPLEEKAIVSRLKVPAFREWLEQ
jgi:DNA-binding LytR/AlgR family response regulator